MYVDVVVAFSLSNNFALFSKISLRLGERASPPKLEQNLPILAKNFYFGEEV